MRNLAKVFVAFIMVIGVWRSWIAPSAGGVRPERAPRPPASAVMPIERGGQGIRVQVPRVIGLEVSFAKHVLRATGLRTGRIRLEASLEPWGAVISQSIAPSSPVRARTYVDLVVAKPWFPSPGRIGGSRRPRSGAPGSEEVASRAPSSSV